MKNKKLEKSVLVAFYHKKYDVVRQNAEIWKRKLQSIVDTFHSLGKFKSLTESEFKSFFIDEIPDKPNVEKINDILLEKALDGQKLEIAGIKIKKEALDLQMPDITKLVNEIRDLPYNIIPMRWTFFKYNKGHIELNETSLNQTKLQECSFFVENTIQLERYKKVKKVIDALNELFESSKLPKDYKHKLADGNIVRVYEGQLIPGETFIKEGTIRARVHFPNDNNSPNMKTTPESIMKEGSRYVAASMIKNDRDLKIS